MLIYTKILDGKFRFTRSFDKNAKSLVKHLLVADTTKRYGNLKNGVDDIINHRWFSGLSFKKVFRKEIDPPYVPHIKYAYDTSN